MDPEQMVCLPDDRRIKKILVIKWSALGDVVISTAMFEGIRQAFPHAQIDLNTLPPWDRVLFAGDPRFNQILTVDLKGKERGWRGLVKWLSQMGRRRYDLIIDLQTNNRSRLLVGLLTLFGRGGAFRLSIHRQFPYNVAPEPVAGGAQHIYDLQKRALAFAGIRAVAKQPVLAVPAASREKVARLLATHHLDSCRYAVFFPGSSPSGRLKRWGVDNYANLALALTRQALERVVLIGGRDELDECRRIVELAGPDIVTNLCGETEILDIIPLCEKAQLIVGNDTGTAHVAACTERPMVIICGPTDPRRVKPVGDSIVALQAGLDCVNCYLKECSHHSCMKAITVDMVLNRLRDLKAL